MVRLGTRMKDRCVFVYIREIEYLERTGKELTA